MSVPILYWRLGVKYGNPARGICWLVGPTAFDRNLPPGYRLEYQVLLPGRGYPNIPWVHHKSFDQTEIAKLSRQLYQCNQPHHLRTMWRDERGHYVKKIGVATASEEARALIERLTA